MFGRYLILVSFGLGVSSASAAPAHRVSVLETRNKKFHGLLKNLGAALAGEGFEIVSAQRLALAARRQGLSLAKVSDEQLRALGRTAGIDVLIRAKATGAHNAFTLQVAAEATDARKRIYATRLIVAASKLDAATAQTLARAIHNADKVGSAAASAPASDAVEFAPDEPGDEDLTTEEVEEEETLDPDEARARDAPKDNVIVEAGFAALMRSAQNAAVSGQPPHYDGALSPGIAFAIGLFPARFRETTGAGRDFGLIVRGNLAFMPSEVGGLAAPSVRNDIYYSLQGGLAYRHVFGVSNKNIALGAELALRWDFMHLANDLPYPDTMFLSPSVAVNFEAPLWPRHLVLLVRAAVLPVSAVGGGQTDAFAARRTAFGLDALLGVRVPLYRGVLFADGAGVVSNYWQSYSGTGTAGFKNVSGTDLVTGFTVSLGVNE